MKKITMQTEKRGKMFTLMMRRTCKYIWNFHRACRMCSGSQDALSIFLMIIFGNCLDSMCEREGSWHPSSALRRKHSESEQDSLPSAAFPSRFFQCFPHSRPLFSVFDLTPLLSDIFQPLIFEHKKVWKLYLGLFVLWYVLCVYGSVRPMISSQ